MVRYDVICMFTCDLCGVRHTALEGTKNWVEPPTLWEKIRGKRRINMDICSDCIAVIKEARRTHRDPLVDLVARKREEI